MDCLKEFPLKKLILYADEFKLKQVPGAVLNVSGIRFLLLLMYDYHLQIILCTYLI